MSPLPPCVSDPLAAVAELFESAASAAEPDADGDWGVKAQFQAALAQPGVLERVSCEICFFPTFRRQTPAASSLPPPARPTALSLIHI